MSIRNIDQVIKIIQKRMMIVSSCKTDEQYEVAKRWIKLADKRVKELMK